MTLVVVLMLLTATTAWAQETISGLTYNTAGGYYEINDAQDLIDLATYVNAGHDASGKTFKQTADITFSHSTDWNNTSSSESNFSGIGAGDLYFKGSYYGQGFTISGLRMSVYDERVGLFRNVCNATIDGIVLTDSRITGGYYTGGIVGNTYRDGGNCIVSNCHVRSDVLIHVIVNQVQYHGGIVGYNGNGCVVTNCTSAVTMTGGSGCFYFGGIVGYNAGTISNSIAIGVTIGNIDSYYGAISGVCWTAVLSNNYYFDCTVQGRTSGIGNNGSDPVGAFNASPDHFTASGSEYSIKTAIGWSVFCECLNHNARYSRFSGKTVKLDTSIEVSRMAGSESHDFCGTFDGQENTLTFNYGTADAYSSEEYIAPFHCVSTVTTNNVETPAAIKDLHVAGDIYTSAKYAAGLVAQHWGTLNIENCRVSTVIHSSVSGDGTHGGFEAVNVGTLNIKGCVFDGKLLSTGETATKNCGGFVGWHNGGTTNISNSLYAPGTLGTGETEVGPGTVGDHPSSTFGRDAVNSISNSYYTRTLGTAQGKQMHSITAGTNVTSLGISGTATAYSVSGITAYSLTPDPSPTGEGSFSPGLKYGDVLYAGSGDAVSLTLSHTTVSAGYSFSDYTVSAGTLQGTTLTMPSANVTISALYSLNSYTITYNLAGGSVAGVNPTTFNIETETFTLINPTRAGYTFSGWTGSNGNTPQTTVTIAKGSTENRTYTAHWTPYPAHFSVSGDEYTIHTAEGWGVFCDLLNDATYNRFSGKTVKLGNNIGTAQEPITRMAGSSGHDFCGTFDGDGKTLTITLSGSSDRMAPFSYVSTTKANPNNEADSPAVIRRLNVVANINTSGQNAGGIVGEAWGQLTIEHCTISGTIATSKQFAGGIIGSVSNSPLNITDCHSSVIISSSKSGDGTHGGFAGRVPSDATLNISGCLFDGKIVTTNGTTNCGGFVGHSENLAGTNVTIANSLYAPTADANTVNEGCETFARNVADANITNCYYTAELGMAQGKAPRTVTGGAGVTVSAVSPIGSPTSSDGYQGVYNVSGITAYAKGITRTVGQATTFYYGSGDNVSLTLSHSDRTGYTFTGYTASAGTLIGNDTDGYTLTMPDDGDVTINATWTPITYNITYNLAGGSMTGVNPTTFNIETETFTLINPTRAGYTFSGWTGSNGNTPQTTVTIAKGSTENRTYIANWTLDPAHFSVSGDTYTIHTATGWGVFCDLLNDATYNRFSGKTVKLDANIEVSRMAGSDNHGFCGTFDGDYKTLTVTLSGSSDRMAPFSYVSTTKANPNDEADSPAVIRRLNVVANINTSGQNAGGIVGEAWGQLTIEQCTVSGTIATSKQFAGGIIGSVSNSPLNITDCHSSVTISSSVNGDGTHGGFAARVPSSASLNISGCVFDGKIVTTNGTTNCGGFVGHSENQAGTNVSIANSFYAPTAADNTVSTGCATFGRNVTAANITNCYYTRTLGTAQGKAPRTVTASENVTIAPSGTATEYVTTGITAYKDGETQLDGLKYGDVLYAGSGDNVSLTLSHSDRTGYTFDGYTASAGTLSGTENPYTLTMPDADVTINATWTPITYTISYNENGGTFSTEKNSYTVESDDIILDKPTRESFIFGGWYENSNFSGNAVTTIAHGSTGNKTFYARWGIPYIDANGNTQACCNYTVLTNETHVSDLPSGWYVVDGTVSYNSTLLCSNGDLHLILCDGADMTIETDVPAILTNGNLTIYAQSSGSSMGKLTATSTSYDGIYSDFGSITICGGKINATSRNDDFYSSIGAYNDVTIHSGQVSATGHNAIRASGNITLGLRNATDFITASSYNGTVKVAGGQALYYEEGGTKHFLTGTLDKGTIAGKTLKPAPSIILADNADNATTISDSDGETAIVSLQGRTLYQDGDWNTLCLPFNATKTGPLAGATIKEIDTETAYNGHKTGIENGTLYLNFRDAESIVAGRPYIVKWDADLIISSASEWETFAANVNNGTESYEGKVVALSNDFDNASSPVTTMVGTSTNKFKGTFNGMGRTLTVNLSDAAEYCAPFRYVDGVTITALRTAGTVTAGTDATNDKFRSGLVGQANGNVTIRNCRSSVTITSSISGDGTHGGFIGINGGSTRIVNCLFDGMLLTTAENLTNSCGGFVGWNSGALTINNSLYAPATTIPDGKYTIGTSGSATFARNYLMPANSHNYYTVTLDNAQGEPAPSDNGDLLSALSDGWEIADGKVVPKLIPAIVSPVFAGVTINDSAPTAISSEDGKVSFTGSYDPASIAGEDRSILFLGAKNTLYYPNAAMTIKACRAYFQLNDGLTAGDPTNGVRTFNLNFGDGEASGITTTDYTDYTDYTDSDDSWYSLDGRKLDKRPTKAGLYIYAGRKVVVK